MFLSVNRIVDGAEEYLNHYGAQGSLWLPEMNLTDIIGLELARLADLPEDVWIEGKRVADALDALHARHEEESKSSQAATRPLEHSALPDQELLAYVHRFQDDIAKTFLPVK
ncbi:hypothetical protein H0H87_007712 [Tephrocybe sp. NHM501043]|nr:hypothetical protein H0H87_007712 [Tephrocybe sp. NHM501043]